MNNANGIGPAKLIKEFFGTDTPNNQIIGLPSADRIQLGSAIARAKGISPEELNFTPVKY